MQTSRTMVWSVLDDAAFAWAATVVRTTVVRAATVVMDGESTNGLPSPRDLRPKLPMNDVSSPYIVAIGGTLRSGSSTERAMQHVLKTARDAGARTRLISGAALQLPMYQPDNVERSDAARDLVAQLALADGIILGSPGYHGSISGLVKNALDYAEDLRNNARPYFSGRAVGCIATAGGWSGAVNTLSALRDIVHALRGWPTPLGAAINTSERVFDDEGSCLVPRVAQTLDLMAGEVMSFLRPIAR